jgi:trans-2,3-dihydro-3-hydroxyanthranilate isomerase
VPLTLRYVVADVFTDKALTGNQLAVFTDGREVDDETMQLLAREMNLSETVFVLPPEAGGHARIRIFTPAAELPFAGHPTLGSAFVLGQPLQLSEIRLETGAGVVPVRLEREGARITFGWMTQPTPQWRTYERADELLAVLGVESELPVEWYDLGPSFVYVALPSPDDVASLRPDLNALADFESGVYCFAALDGRWKSRMFAPGSGVAEDPATGSAAGPLAVHLLRHGWIAAGDEIEIEQGVELKRPSRLYARVFGTSTEIERVEVGGGAVVVARGEFRLP